ncbi:hypothetical protein HYH70_17890 [Clostridium botulinum]|uniref:hypothetical protein n=1 Tax=Clostridium botulinum TaxID=1491 RepID=UPI0006A6F5CC|nr:hypothetical protein [Clostridium botulinum]KON09702.1 hypothetical protein ACP52_08480 [Clostridium botulinum]MBY6907440.1 hypothetical protein [Clostridium botulinum]MBY6927752.1 hypothetical protein [Clostridium botulinum]MBY6955086.1 hypothetical protein [Clostridium botulinum]MCR1178828.1 hypothetical protein [Clostridium botulinum]
MKLSKFLDKHIFSQKEEIHSKNIYKKNEEKYCKNFEKGNNGFCKHYMGCKVDIVSCARECEVGGIDEDRKDIKNTAAEHT